MPRIIPIRDLKNTAAVSQMCSESKEPVYITKNGYGDMVIMSMEAYEEKMQLLDAYAKLDAAEQQVEAGQTQDARSALQELRARYGILVGGNSPCYNTKPPTRMSGRFYYAQL